MTEVVAALIWDKDKFIICQCPAQKSAVFCGYSYFCLCTFQNLFFHKAKKASRLLTNSPYPSSRIVSPPFSLLPLQNFDLQGHYSTTQPVNNHQQKTTVILPKLRWLFGRSAETRTPCLLVPNQALYQMSYTSVHLLLGYAATHLCYFNISGRVCQAGDWAGNCACSIRAYAYAKKNTTALAHAGAVVFFGG